MNGRNLNKQELKSDLEQFRDSISNVIDLEDRLTEIALKLNGNTIHSIKIKSMDEAKYQRGSRNYRNDITELMFLEEQLIKKRDYYLYRVKRVESFLQSLNEKQVELIEYRYWYGYSIRAIEELIPCSKSKIARDLNTMIDNYLEEK